MRIIKTIKNQINDITFGFFNNLNRKLDDYKGLKIIISKFYDKMLHLQQKIKSIIYGDHPHSYQIIKINPINLKYRLFIRDLEISENQNIFKLKFLQPLLGLFIRDHIKYLNGDWDLSKNLKKISELIHFKSFYNHFIKKIPWEKTEYYKEQLKKISEGKNYYFDSEKKLNWRFKNYEGLYKKIKKEGYISQQELIKKEGYFDKMGRFSKLRKIDDEITIAIGRKGLPIFLDGIHRLVIAQLLDIEVIPVKIIFIHKEWIKSKRLLR